MLNIIKLRRLSLNKYRYVLSEILVLAHLLELVSTPDQYIILHNNIIYCIQYRSMEDSSNSVI